MGVLRQFQSDTIVANEDSAKAVRRPKCSPLTTASGKALVRAGEAARKTARTYRTAVCVGRNGEVVADKPSPQGGQRYDVLYRATKIA